MQHVKIFSDLLSSKTINKFAFFLLLLMSTPLFSQSIPELKIIQRQKQMFSSKPVLSQRLSGIKDIVLLVPSNYTSSEYSSYIYDNMKYYLERLGLEVIVTPANYTVKTVGHITALIYDDDIQNVLPVNILSCSVDYNNVNNRITIDFMNGGVGYKWTYTIDMKNGSDKFQQQLRNTICDSRTYNSRYSIIVGGYMSNWNESILKSNFENVGCDDIEGIYENNNYRLGVIKDKDGVYYILNLERDEFYDWKVGEIKAIMSPTATSNIFKAKWWGLRKELMSQVITFTGGHMVTYCEEFDEKLSYLKMYPYAKTQQK